MTDGIRQWLNPDVQHRAERPETLEEAANPVDSWARRWVGFVPPAISISRKEMIDLLIKRHQNVVF